VPDVTSTAIPIRVGHSAGPLRPRALQIAAAVRGRNVVLRTQDEDNERRGAKERTTGRSEKTRVIVVAVCPHWRRVDMLFENSPSQICLAVCPLAVFRRPFGRSTQKVRTTMIVQSASIAILLLSHASFPSAGGSNQI